MSTQHINLDITKSIFPGQIIRMGQGDSSGTTIVASIYDGGMPLQLDGKSAVFMMRQPDNEHYVRDINCSVSGNTVTYVVNEENVASVRGYTDEAYFDIIDGQTIYSTTRFRVKIERAAHDGAIPAEDWDNAVDALIEHGNEQLERFTEAEEDRESAESTRQANESARQTQESLRASAERSRANAETGRVNAEDARVAAEAARVTAEQGRVTAENGRVTADQQRTTNQEANNTAQSANNTAQTANDTAQSNNDSAQVTNDANQAQNNLDQQRNNEAAASGYTRYLVSGEYDPTTGQPTISAATEMRMVITPNPDQSDPNNRMLEWARRSDDGGTTWTWELVGGTGWKPTPATTAQANAMWDGEQTVTSSDNPDVSWMSYYATKIREWVTNKFVGINTVARVAQVVSSGEIQATVSSVVHRLSEKLNASDYHRAMTWGEVGDKFTWGVLGTPSQVTGTTYTTNLNLEKPGYDSTVDVSTLNDNYDIIDEEVSENSTAIAEVADMVGNVDVDTDGDLATQVSNLQDSVNNTYSGRNLATVLADEAEDAGGIYAALHARVAAANYDGLRIGDWMDVPLTARSGTITQSTVRYVIAAFDHYYDCSDQPIGHHIVFVPYAPVDMTGSSYATNTSYIMWNTTATNQGTSAENNPYLVSNLHKWELNEFLGKLPSTLQGYLLDHRSLCESRYSASASLNASTGWGWKSLGKIWSPSEMEVYGCCAWGTPGYSQGMDSQFPLFRETRDRIMGGRVHWWLRVVSGSSASNVCHVGHTGTAHDNSATNTRVRPRPCFLLG